jgi:5-formyltetrahydrofolate cyclo-ligase
VSKSALRKKYRDIRSKISATDRQKAAHAAAILFAKQPFFIKAQNIACYLPFKDEFDSLPLIEQIWLAKKQCFLPVLSQINNQNSLIFVRYNYGDSLRVNQFSILEPSNVTRTISPEQLDVVIMPLVAFDKHGHRLGTGGGYYDRTFKFILEPAAKTPRMVGLGYAAQEADELPADPWDIKMTNVITENDIVNCF